MQLFNNGVPYNASSVVHSLFSRREAFCKMPAMISSIRSIAKTARNYVQLALFFSANPGQSTSASCPNAQLSCSSGATTTNYCCFNYPGGLLLQTQFWDTNPPTGPSDSWTIHGLWSVHLWHLQITFPIDLFSRPDNCDGTYEANCDPAREYTNIRQIISDAGATDLLSYMNTYWKDYQGDDDSFWSHEWGKHGTCISTLETSCYTNYVAKEEVVAFFQKTVDLFKTLPSYQVRQSPYRYCENFANCAPISSFRLLGLFLPILPHTPLQQSMLLLGLLEESTPSSNVKTEHWMRFGTFTMSREVYNLAHFLQQIQVSISHITRRFQTTDNLFHTVGTTSSCPSTGIKYVPKGTSPGGGGGGLPSGKGTLPISSGGVQNGCVISGGTWYTSGTCASFTATPSGTVSQVPISQWHALIFL